MTIKRILCPTALTAGSDGALRFALALARAYDAKLIAFHCKPANGNGVVEQSEVKASLEESIFQRLETAELSTIDWERVVETCDDPGTTITKYAADHSVDLIVMRSRRRPHMAALLGSTAESVCLTDPCSVLVTYYDEREWVGATMREF